MIEENPVMSLYNTHTGGRKHTGCSGKEESGTDGLEEVEFFAGLWYRGGEQGAPGHGWWAYLNRPLGIEEAHS